MPRPLEIPEPWRSLARRCGGGGLCADRIGIDYSTLWRLAHRLQTPTPTHQKRIEDLCRRFNLDVQEFFA